MLWEMGHIPYERVSRAWNIPMSSIFDHLNGKTRSRKMRLGGVLIEEKDAK
jgi:hypothetical protein